jgi:hypothetical protein
MAWVGLDCYAPVVVHRLWDCQRYSQHNYDYTANQTPSSRLGKPRPGKSTLERKWPSSEPKVQLQYVLFSLPLPSYPNIYASTPNPEKRLLEAVAIQIQMHKPEQVPTPETSVPSRAPPKSATPKGQAAMMGQRKSFKVPQAPHPWPKLQDRVSPYSPMADAGIYVDAVSVSAEWGESGSGVDVGGRMRWRLRRRTQRVRRVLLRASRKLKLALQQERGRRRLSVCVGKVGYLSESACDL